MSNLGVNDSRPIVWNCIPSSRVRSQPPLTRVPTDPNIVSETFVPARVSTVDELVVEGEAILHDHTTERVHLLNPTAALLWKCFDGETTLAELAFEIADEMDIPVAGVLTDIVRVTSDLVEEGVLLDARASRVENTGPVPSTAEPEPGLPRLLVDPPNP